MTLGFACYWGPNRRATWSGTPLHLYRELSARTDVADLDLTHPRFVQKALRAAYARRHDRTWESQWRRSTASMSIAERKLRSLTKENRPSAILQIQDLAIADVPYGVLQDLSCDLVIEMYGEQGEGAPHFRTLSLSRHLRLRERQVQVYSSAAVLFPMRPMAR